MADKLAGVHPILVEKVRKILVAMNALGFTMTVTDGVRTLAQQQQLYKQGRTLSGVIVTQADGVIKKSNHQVKADGWGRAVDCAFWVDDQPSWDSTLPWKTYGACAEALGLKWGGNWGGFVDRPHIELP